MKRVIVSLAIALPLSACGWFDRASAPPPEQQPRTIENAQVAPLPIEEPPTVTEEVPLAIPKYATPQEIEQIRANSKMKVDLPFSPAIAIDPVDLGKVSIRSNTPTVEYKKKIYYFSSEANKKTFMANPEQYAKSLL